MGGDGRPEGSGRAAEDHALLPSSAPLGCAGIVWGPPESGGGGGGGQGLDDSAAGGGGGPFCPAPRAAMRRELTLQHARDRAASGGWVF